jgi:hypothetical protein
MTNCSPKQIFLAVFHMPRKANNRRVAIFTKICPNLPKNNNTACYCRLSTCSVERASKKLQQSWDEIEAGFAKDLRCLVG